VNLASWRSQATLLITPLLVAGSVAAIAVIGSADQHRALAREWSAAGDLAQARAYSSATVLADGAVLIVGGLDGDSRDRTSTKAELFDPLAGRSVALPAVPGRVHHTATRTGELVVVTGGVEFVGKDWTALARTDVFDTRTRAWHVAGSLARKRSDARATTLKDGRVLVAGGHDGPQLLGSVEIFDPRTNEWTAAAPLPIARSQFTIATLPDGRVLAAGGLEAPGIPSNTSALYDPAANAWTLGPRLLYERALHADAQLADGSVLLVGGQKSAGGSVEMYDARLGQFVVYGRLAEGRMLAQAAVLPDGSVLVTGGVSPQGDATEFTPRQSAERSDPASRAFQPYASPADARAFAKLAVLGAGVYQIGGISRGERGTSSVETLAWR
jgi:hypothetical protein